MPQTLREFQENPGSKTVELCGCGCGEPLEKNDPLGLYWVGVGTDRKLINADCYFDRMGKAIDEHPIGGLGMNGPKNTGPID